ncbi:MAG: hypothetical protein Q9211_003325 [Gyalolechia sp. 1 TL-2023]
MLVLRLVRTPRPLDGFHAPIVALSGPLPYLQGMMGHVFVNEGLGELAARSHQVGLPHTPRRPTGVGLVPGLSTQALLSLSSEETPSPGRMVELSCAPSVLQEPGVKGSNSEALYNKTMTGPSTI